MARAWLGAARQRGSAAAAAAESLRARHSRRLKGGFAAAGVGGDGDGVGFGGLAERAGSLGGAGAVQGPAAQTRVVMFNALLEGAKGARRAGRKVSDGGSHVGFTARFKGMASCSRQGLASRQAASACSSSQHMLPFARMCDLLNSST